MGLLDNKVAIITGSGRGIGAADKRSQGNWPGVVTLDHRQHRAGQSVEALGSRLASPEAGASRGCDHGRHVAASRRFARHAGVGAFGRQSAKSRHRKVVANKAARAVTRRADTRD